MNIYNALNIDLEKHKLICFVGAGGKTTTMFSLAKELCQLNKRVLVTTTTAIFYPENEYCNKIIVTGNCYDINDLKQDREEGITVIGREVSKEGKLLGISKDFADEIFNCNLFDFILVEADGAKMKPIKAANPYEPVIPNNTTQVIGLIGLDCLGKRINEDNVHRSKLFCKATSSQMNDVIDEYIVSKLIMCDKGLFKGCTKIHSKSVILNKAEKQNTIDSARFIKSLLSDRIREDIHIIIASMFNKEFYV